MFLNIKGIGKIHDSTIEMKGITVIAGENNSGKSTFGKTLYCMVDAFYDAEAAIHREHVNDIRHIFRRHIPRPMWRFVTGDFIEDYLRPDDTDNFDAKIMSFINSIDAPPEINNLDVLKADIKKSVSVGKDEIQKMMISRSFRAEFFGRINHLNRPDSEGSVTLEIKGKKIIAAMNANKCTHYSDDVGLMHEAIYIDTPFIMDELNFFERGNTGFYPVINHRDNLFERLAKYVPKRTLVEEVIINQKIDNFLTSINQIVSGEFREVDNSLFFLEQGMQAPVPIPNISTGMKAFLIIKRLLELGEIKERGVLILDEPEIHLHPDWQLKFAEVLVLLQKEFNLTILLTTHSPYFLHAVEVYANKYGLKENTNYYLAESKGDTAGVRDVTNFIDTIYKQLARPFQTLENIRYE